MSALSIVVCANGRGLLQDRLRLARTVAARLGAEIDVLAFRSASPPLSARDALGDGGAYDGARVSWQQEDDASREWKATFDDVFPEGAEQASAHWINVYEPLTAFPTYARACDLVIAGGRSSDPSMSTLSDDVSAMALLETGRPALFATHPTLQDTDPFSRVLIAWDDKPAAARAIALGLPFIAASGSVRLVTVEGSPQQATPCNQILAYLRRHAASVEVGAMSSVLHSVGHSIVSEAHAWGASLIVMGAYEHSRGREIVFGGTTRFVIDHAECPVIMAK